MQKVFVDRDRVECAQHCERERWLTYHQGGMGIVSRKKPLPLAVGGSVHEGLAHLLLAGSGFHRKWLENWKGNTPPDVDPESEVWSQSDQWRDIEDVAVNEALLDFATHQAALDAGEEEVAMEPSGVAMQMARTMDTPEALEQLQQLSAKARDEFAQYLYDEQRALVEGLVRAYARRRLRALLERYEVLEVEREGQWLLSSWQVPGTYVHVECATKCGQWGGSSFDEQHPWPHKCPGCGGEVIAESDYATDLWFMSRPDALLRERDSNELYILSFKTAAKWDRRKAEDAKRDMQGLSEGVEVEKRLREWHEALRPAQDDREMMIIAAKIGASHPMARFLKSLPAPPRILGIRYEYMLKGDRWVDKGLSERLGVEARSQRSPLVSAYKNEGMAAGDEQWNVSWDYVKETGETSKLYYKNWKASPVWRDMPVKAWIDRLDAMVETVGENGPMGWSGPGQATGFLSEHPLEELFIPPIVVYRNDDELRDWIEETEAQEVRVAENVARVKAATDEGERRHLLNVLFQKTRRACEYPTTCAFVAVCFGGQEIRANPLGSGKYAVRKPNHPVEGEGR